MGRYLDASVLVPQVVNEPGTPFVEQFITACGDQLIVSDFAAAEVASALSRLVRTRRLVAEAARTALADFDVWRATITITPDMIGADARLAAVYVRRFHLMLRAPNALHAAFRQRLGHVLVTFDTRLATAAHDLGISVEMPGRGPWAAAPCPQPGSTTTAVP